MYCKCAVRVEHIPTGEAAIGSSRRSQHKNREAALHVLRAKLTARERGLEPPQPAPLVRSYHLSEREEGRSYIEEAGRITMLEPQPCLQYGWITDEEADALIEDRIRRAAGR